MKTFIKFLIGFVLASGVVAGSFVGGMIFYAHYYTPARVDSSVTALSIPEATGFDGQTGSAPAGVPSEFSTFWEAWSFLNEQYYGDLPSDADRVYGATRGMVASFGDQHTTFIDPTRAAIMSENISGSFEGIGATIRLDESGRLMIADTFPGRPAFDAGLRPGDFILQVDGQPTENLNLFEAVLMIRGPAGSEVVLTVFRKGEREPFDIDVIRAKIEIEVVQSEMLESGHIGYVQLTQFSKGASEKIAEAVTELFDQGATSLIVDLRSNPGGLLSEAVAVSSLFIEDGTIVVEKLKGGEEKIFTATPGEQMAAEVPLVLLVNGGSASASEIVAGAIQDHSRGTIIGEQTFGKGTVQLPHKLSDGSELRVTVAEWLTPANRQIRNEGIAPDIVVEMTAEDLEQELDPQLEEAIRFLSQQ
jgi:carboxyl-terminal processing protease